MINEREQRESHVCYRASEPIEVAGLLDKPAWTHARRLPRLVDMVTSAPGLFDTRMAATWDDEHLCVGLAK